MLPMLFLYKRKLFQFGFILESFRDEGESRGWCLQIELGWIGLDFILAKKDEA